MFFLIRKLSFLILLALAIGIPYVYFQSTDGAVGQRVRNWWESWKSKDASELVPTGLTAGSKAARPAAGMVVNLSIPQIFRYDWTPDQVIQTWPLVTRVHDDRFLGLRVPLVTGTQPTDLAGSLTYYFDKESQLQRIVFIGTTADARPLVSHVVSHFQLKGEATTEAGLYIARWNGEPKSVLRLSYSPVIQAEAANRSIEVLLELNRPSMHYRLSPMFQQWLEMGRDSVSQKRP